MMFSVIYFVVVSIALGSVRINPSIGFSIFLGPIFIFALAIKIKSLEEKVQAFSGKQEVEVSDELVQKSN